MIQISSKNILVLMLLSFIAINSLFSASKTELQLDSSSKIVHRILLIGDAGEDPSSSGPVLQLLHSRMTDLDQEDISVVFLGDNIYPEGLHKKDHPLRSQDEARINAQLDAVKHHQGEVVFIPGNHDWQQGGKEGFKFNKRQEDYIQKYLDRKAYLPSDGCSGPEAVELSEELILITIDTQWWLHQYRKGRGEKDDCDFSTTTDFVLEFKELLKKYRRKHILVVGHHPLYSNGHHGGYFSWDDHLFPLKNLNSNLWIPLPIIGSVYPWYRSIFGNIQDLQHPIYEDMIRQLTTAMQDYDNLIYAAGHEHNLQYVFKENVHYVVSGAGSKSSHLRHNKKIDFGHEGKGLAELNYFEDGSVELNFYDPLEGKPQTAKLFSKGLYQKEIAHLGSHEKSNYTLKMDSAIAAPDSNMAASKFQRVFLGDLNRDLWTQKIKVPYLDFKTYAGGLYPVSLGGGQQTVSLKLENDQGEIYKARLVKKSARFLVSRDLRGSFAQDMIYDGLAGSHPYGGVSLIEMSKAANVYYTKPKLVMIPDDPILGDHQEAYAEQLAIIERHPDDDMSKVESFGNSEKVVNYRKALGKIQNKHNHQVDENWTLRSRLFDMFIGDWDRHDDQWRWATFQEGDNTIYRPIPRDRDQAYFQFDGVIMNIANRKWLLRKFQNFEKGIRDISGLNFNARYFDRYFLTQLEWEDWKKEVDYLKENIDSTVIHESLLGLPPEAYEVNGAEIEAVLLERIDQLEDFAKRYYKVLAKEVNVLGTTKKDYISIIRHDNGDVEVSIFPLKKKDDPEARRYHRRFKWHETKEVRIYGLGNDDEFHMEGDAKKGILVRIIVEEKGSSITDNSKGLSKSKTKVYTSKAFNDDWESEDPSVRVIEKNEKNAYFYDRKEFQFNRLIPLPVLGFNPDDGFYFGAGLVRTKEGFKKDPYKYRHAISAAYGLGAEGYRIQYKNDYTELIGPFDMGIQLETFNPQVYQFYGLGNNTKILEGQEGNSTIRMNYNLAGLRLSKRSRANASRASLLLNYESYDLQDSDFDELKGGDFDDEFLSALFDYQYQNVDLRANPNKGVKFNFNFGRISSFTDDELDFYRLKTDLSLYIPVNYFRKQTTFAVRGGLSSNFGDHAFYQSNFLSGLNEMRGLTRNRFAGETSVYFNSEIRKSFLKVKNYVAAFDFGMLAHADLGRVYEEGESSKRWHNSIGGGAFLNVLDYLTLVFTYTVSDVDQVFNFGTNFYF